MPLAAAIGVAGDAFASELWPLPAVDPTRVAILGARSLDDAERDFLRRSDVLVLTMTEIDRIGVEAAVEQALVRVAGPGFVHVSLDMDALDPVIAPGSARRSAAASRTGRRTSRSSSSPSRASRARSRSSR